MTRPDHPHVPLWLLALITFSGTMAMHIFVPALPFATADLGTTPAAAQQTLSIYIVGLAVGQLVYGPVSDHFGRRPVLIGGMIVYALAGVAAMLASNIHGLIAARLFQALGGCTGMVLGRAIVRDITAGRDAARSLSLMNLMVMIGPGLSPLLGAALAGSAGWRSIFAVLSTLGAVNLVLTLTLLPETSGGQGHGLPKVLANYLLLLKSPRFLGCAMGGGFATTAIYAYIAVAPFIFMDQLHRPAHEVGLYLAFNIIGVWFGSLAASRLVSRMPIPRVMIMGNLITCAAAAVFLAIVLLGSLSVPSILAPMLILCFGAGLASPTALAEALNVNPLVAGSASGLYGCAQMVIGAICASLGAVGSNPALAAALVMMGGGLLAQAGFWMALKTRPAR